MNIEQIKIETLIPYEFNNKIHWEEQIDRIANSISEFWFTQPLVVDKDNIVIIWHWRLLASQKLGMKKVPCIRMEWLNKTQIKKLRILDNKLNESEWDLWNLKLELDEIDDIELNKLFPEFDAPEYNPDDYDDNMSWDKETKTYIIIEAKDETEAELIKKDVEWLWWKCVIKW